MKCKTLVIALMSLLTASCAAVVDQTSAHPNGEPVAAGNNCDAQARSKLSLFEKPDTYPISDSEKHNAYKALYDECMRGNTQVAAGPKPNFDIAAANTNYATLSPAAGGNPQARTGITVANGVTMIDTSQLSNLSPAAGGVSTGTGTNGSTVIVVQSSPTGAIAAPAAAVAAAPVPTHAAAIPVTPTNAPPVATVAKTEDDAEEKPKAKKTAHAKAKTTSTAATDPSDKRSRFAKNAVKLNNYEPSAGSMLDSAVTVNAPAQKD